MHSHLTNSNEKVTHLIRLQTNQGILGKSWTFMFNKGRRFEKEEFSKTQG